MHNADRRSIRRWQGVPHQIDVTFAATVTTSADACPACGHPGGRVFYEAQSMPVHQVRLLSSREDALTCAKGDIRLVFCPGCGFIWNAAFDPGLISYHEDYESTQAVSPTFTRFHERLARDLVARYELEGRVCSLIPLRNRRQLPDGRWLQTRITEAMTEYRWNGRTALGMSEYLDQIVDGRPSGIGRG